jgi:hypothetical protein
MTLYMKRTNYVKHINYYNVIIICNMRDYKGWFIGLAYTVGDQVAQQWPFACWRVRESGRKNWRSWRLQNKGPMMQPQHKTEGLEIAWWVTGVSLLECGVHWQWQQHRTHLLRRSRSGMCSLASFVFHLCSTLGPSLMYSAAHIQGGLSPSVIFSCVNYLWKGPQRHIQKCALTSPVRLPVKLPSHYFSKIPHTFG